MATYHWRPLQAPAYILCLRCLRRQRSPSQGLHSREYPQKRRFHCSSRFWSPQKNREILYLLEPTYPQGKAIPTLILMVARNHLYRNDPGLAGPKRNTPTCLGVAQRRAPRHPRSAEHSEARSPQPIDWAPEPRVSHTLGVHSTSLRVSGRSLIKASLEAF